MQGPFLIHLESLPFRGIHHRRGCLAVNDRPQHRAGRQPRSHRVAVERKILCPQLGRIRTRDTGCDIVEVIENVGAGGGSRPQRFMVGEAEDDTVMRPGNRL